MPLRELLWEVRRRLGPARYPKAMADWPHRLRRDLSQEQIRDLQGRVEDLHRRSQYGWGHSIDFGPFRKEGFLEWQYLEIAGLFDRWEWWPRDLEGMIAADVGCFTGGLSVLLAGRGARRVYAVDEVPEHLDQCRLLCQAFEIDNVTPLETSVYQLSQRIPPGSLDMILLAGVLYHLSDMLVGLLVMRELLRPDGLLLVETNALEDAGRSFANFGRYYGGMWWQPSTLCIEDMCQYMGFEGIEIRFYKPDRCLVRARRGAVEEIPFKRGLNWPFASLQDAERRTMDRKVMAPVKPRL